MSTRQQLTKYIYNRLKVWDRKGFNPQSINCGNCENFAKELEKKFPQGFAVWGEDYLDFFNTDVDCSGHCFFVFEMLYWDSECPEGTDYPDSLPFYARQLAAKNWGQIEYIAKIA